MPTVPFGFPRFQALDSNGVPLVGGLLYAYKAGTTTPLATYTDRSGAIANSNPVVLDASGYADVWLTPSTLYKFILRDTNGAVLWSVDNFPAAADSSANTSNAVADPGGRLTLTAGTPVTTLDVTGATTAYYLPNASDVVPLFDGAAWALYSIGAGLSQAISDNTKSPAAGVANAIYDMFVWRDPNGVLRLSRGPLWPSETSRGSGIGTTELQQVNGRQVNKNAITNGPESLRGLYVGTIRTDSSAHLTDSANKRYCWNAYAQVRRNLSALDGTADWVYNTPTWRQVRGNSGNRFSMVIGLPSGIVSAAATAFASNNSTNQNYNVATGIGLDSTIALASGCVAAPVTIPGGITGTWGYFPLSAIWSGFPGIGFHIVNWLEYGNDPGGGGNNFFNGSLFNSDPALFGQAGLIGEMMA